MMQYLTSQGSRNRRNERFLQRRCQKLPSFVSYNKNLFSMSLSPFRSPQLCKFYVCSEDMSCEFRGIAVERNIAVLFSSVFISSFQTRTSRSEDGVPRHGMLPGKKCDPQQRKISVPIHKLYGLQLTARFSALAEHGGFTCYALSHSSL